MRQAALRLSESFERSLSLEAPLDGARASVALRDRDQELLRRCDDCAARRGHIEPDSHALVVVLEQLTGDCERIALLRFLEIVQHHLQGEQTLPGPLARGRVET